MRIIGHIEHPELKITVFKMENRLSVKFENEGYEETFKLRHDDRIDGFEAVQRWADAQLINDVLHRMQDMHRSSLAAFIRAFPPENDSNFEEII